MKIATFNIQNLFHRDKSLLEKPFGKNLTDWILIILPEGYLY